MDDLKPIIQKHPQCLADSHRLKSTLKDYGWSDSKLEVVVNLYELGIVDTIRKSNGYLSQETVYSITSQQQKRHATAEDAIYDGIRMWADALDAVVDLKPASEPPQPLEDPLFKPFTEQPETPRRPPVVLPEESILTKPQRNKFEKILLAFGYVCAVVLLGALGACLASFDEVAAAASWIMVAPVSLTALYVFSQVQLQRKGFGQLVKGEMAKGLLTGWGIIGLFSVFMVSILAMGGICRYYVLAFGTCALYLSLWNIGEVMTYEVTHKSKSEEQETSGGFLLFTPILIIIMTIAFMH